MLAQIWDRVYKEQDVSLTQPPLLLNQDVRLLRTNSPMQSTMVWTIAGWPWRTQSTANAPATAYRETTFPHVTPDRRQVVEQNEHPRFFFKAFVCCRLNVRTHWQNNAKMCFAYKWLFDDLMAKRSRTLRSHSGAGVVSSAALVILSSSLRSRTNKLEKPQRQRGIMALCLSAPQRRNHKHKAQASRQAGRQAGRQAVD